MRTIDRHNAAAPGRADAVDKKPSGFTLIELVVVIAIIGILAAIAYPSYLDQIRKSRRSDGKAMLQEVASRLEQFYLDNKVFTPTMTNLGYVADTNVDSPEKWYKAAVTTNTVACPRVSCYIITATPQRDQANDTKCANLTFNNKQEKGASGALGRQCW